MREFTDAQGRRWTVWNTIPNWHVGVPVQLQSGWLTFECASERRRLAPIPADWEASSEVTLESYCRRARRVSGETRVRDADRDAR